MQPSDLGADVALAIVRAVDADHRWVAALIDRAMHDAVRATGPPRTPPTGALASLARYELAVACGCPWTEQWFRRRLVDHVSVTRCPDGTTVTVGRGCVRRDLDQMTRMCALAAGDAALLRRLRAEGCVWDATTCRAAAAAGDAATLTWARDNGCPVRPRGRPRGRGGRAARGAAAGRQLGDRPADVQSSARRVDVRGGGARRSTWRSSAGRATTATRGAIRRRRRRRPTATPTWCGGRSRTAARGASRRAMRRLEAATWRCSAGHTTTAVRGAIGRPGSGGPRPHPRGAVGGRKRGAPLTPARPCAQGLSAGSSRAGSSSCRHIWAGRQHIAATWSCCSGSTGADTGWTSPRAAESGGHLAVLQWLHAQGDELALIGRTAVANGRADMVGG